MATIVTVNPRDIVRASGLDVDLPVYARAAIEDEELLAIWGLAWSPEPRRCWIWFHIEHSDPRFARTVIREAKKTLRHAVQLGDNEVYTPRDDQYPSSTKLLKMLGFDYFAHENGVEVWKWRS